MDTIALILSIIGSLNWGLVGIFKFDLVAWIFGGQTAVVSRIIYTLVGLAGLWCISLLFRKRSSGSESLPRSPHRSHAKPLGAKHPRAAVHLRRCTSQSAQSPWLSLWESCQRS